MAKFSENPITFQKAIISKLFSELGIKFSLVFSSG